MGVRHKLLVALKSTRRDDSLDTRDIVVNFVLPYVAKLWKAVAAFVIDLYQIGMGFTISDSRTTSGAIFKHKDPVVSLPHFL